MTAQLPELATLLANYLRYATGDRYVYARVIPKDDPENQEERDYIAVGHCVQGVEAEFYNVVPADHGFYSLLRVIDYPGSRNEPPSSDVVPVRSGHLNASGVLSVIASQMFGDKLASAQECLAYDLAHPDGEA